ncbi:MAG: ATP-dependent zinc protease [Gammaproteobacteria bacterium HGW-Gammaproteobacteria-3]|nr:MAG: ATP-dependent zinc protease [Gammaproteobacteria bacterium HGW-Gammaproteobacteria-3]
MNPDENALSALGWREWLALPEFNIRRIKAKVDTGARTSALHAFFIDPYLKGSQHWLVFGIHPNQHDRDTIIECHAPVKDRRLVSDSGGHKSRRYVIETRILIGHFLLTTEMTLTNRDSMKFRMLLGRTALQNNFVINPQASFLQGKPDKTLYQNNL